MRKFFPLLMVWILAGGLGCAGAKKLVSEMVEKPTLTVQGVRLVGLVGTAVEFEVTLAVDNPNPVGLRLSRLSYALALEGSRAISGQAEQAAQIPATGVGALVFPVSLDYQELVAAYDRLKGRDEIGYELSGELAVATPIGDLPLPYRAAGKLPVIRVPRLANLSLRVDALGLRETRLRFLFVIENPNAFAMEVKGLRYRIALAGREFAAGEIQAGLSLPPKGSATLELPLRLSLLELGSWAYSLLTGRSADYRLEYDADYRALDGTIRQKLDREGTLEIKR